MTFFQYWLDLVQVSGWEDMRPGTLDILSDAMDTVGIKAIVLQGGN